MIGERRPDEPCAYGMRGNSIVRHFGESYENLVLVGGFSKAYSSLLAFIACPTALKQLLKMAASPYLYSGPSPVASLATVLVGLRGQRQPGRRAARVLYDAPGACSTAWPAWEFTPRTTPASRSSRCRCETRADRGGRPDAVRPGHLRDDGGLSARPPGRGRLPDPGDGGEHRRAGRHAVHRPSRSWPPRRAAARGRPRNESTSQAA